jgi:hypothetical protein
MPIPIPIIDGALKLINSVVDKAVPDADKRIALKAELAAQLAKGEFDLEMASINAVNATMQAEAKSEHWMQWAWRPTIGFTFAAVIINNFILLPYISGLVPLLIPGEVWSAMLVILGASAATRGWEKVQKIK